MAIEVKQFLSLSGLQEYDTLLKQGIDSALAQIPTTNIIHGDAKTILSSIIETYILNINYETLAFDTLELVISGSGSSGGSSSSGDKTSPILGTGMLGYMVLA